MKLTDEAVATIAKEAVADVRTVLRRLAGLPVRGGVAGRIDAAIERLKKNHVRHQPGRAMTE